MVADQEPGLPGWCWGTNPPTSVGGGHVHVVHPDQPNRALCGLLADECWEVRPPQPELLCPECSMAAMDLMYPPFAEPAPTGRHRGAEDTLVQIVERTIVLPIVRDGDP
jgi:hypothetical protein